MFQFLFIAIVLLSAVPVVAADIHVSSSVGNDENDGSKESPFQSIERAIKAAKVGDEVLVAGGAYGDRGFIEIPFPLSLKGGYAADFSKRDVRRFRTLIQPTNDTAKSARKPLMALKKSAAGQHFVVDGFVFDMGQRNSYSDEGTFDTGTGVLLLPPAFNAKQDRHPTVTAQCLFIENPASAGDVTIQNNVFANCAQFGIQGGHRGGSFRVLNNVFVANRMAAIEIFGTGGKKGPKGPISSDGTVEIAYNTIAFTWSRQPDMKDMGYGIRVMTMLDYHIHHNVIVGSVMTGIDHTRFNPGDWIRVEHNVLFGNREGALLFSRAGKVEMERIAITEFKDLELASVTGNRGDKTAMPFSMPYLKGFLAAAFRDSADMVQGSEANAVRRAFDLPPVSTPSAAPFLYANRYPLEDAFRLFGAHATCGAQIPK